MRREANFIGIPPSTAAGRRKRMIERIEGLNIICGREECGITNPLLCWGCLGDEANDEMYDDHPSTKGGAR